MGAHRRIIIESKHFILFKHKKTVEKEVGFPFLPLMDPSSLVTQCYGDCSVFTQVEVVAIVMVVGGNPSNPHGSRVLTSKDPYRVVVLK